MKQRYIPANSAAREFLEVNAVIYTHEIIKDGVTIPYAIGYCGKRSKPDFNFRYRNLEHREKHIQEYIDALYTDKKAKEARREKSKSFVHSLKVGDILDCSWGYDQTNVDFYQVIEVIGKMVKIKEIHASMPNGEEGFMTGYVIPIKDKFANDEVLLKKVGEGNRVAVQNYSSASLWDGRPCRTSWYA